MVTNTDVVVFTHDLRVADNPALSAAGQADRVRRHTSSLVVSARHCDS